MKRFIFKFLIFSLVLMVLFLTIGLFKKKDSSPSDYMAAIIDKHQHLDVIKTPRVILGGGSNLAFGIDSKELEKALGVPVINMGLHAGLGLDFILDDLKYSIRENDIVILSIEYFLWRDGLYDLKLNTSNSYPPAKRFYSKNYIKELEKYLENRQIIFQNIFSLNKNKSDGISEKSLRANTIYTRSGFNSNGDVISHLNKPNPDTFSTSSPIHYRFWEGIEVLNNFYEFAKSKRVNVFFLYPNYPASAYEKNKVAIRMLEADLKQNLKIEILNTPSDLVLPDSCFFDTEYHLNKQGRKERTRKVIEEIEKSRNFQSCIFKIRDSNNAVSNNSSKPSKYSNWHSLSNFKRN
jgi:hypothetical protein